MVPPNAADTGVQVELVSGLRVLSDLSALATRRYLFG
jgi:hypothetical protein